MVSSFFCFQTLVVASTISIVSAEFVNNLLTSKHHPHHHHSQDPQNNSQTEKYFPSDSSPIVLEAAYFPNIDYLAKGYNIYKGDPLSTFGDPGFTASAIVNFEYTDGKQTSDMRYLIPDFVDANPLQSCQLTFYSEEINGETSLTKTFQQDVSSEGDVMGAALFKGSKSFKTKSEEIQTRKYLYVNSKASCSLYRAAFEPFSSPKISSALERGLQGIGAQTFAQKPLIYFDLIDKFGTHKVQELVMGAKYGHTSKLPRESASRLSQEGLTVTAGASYSSMVSASVSSTTAAQKQLAGKFDRATESRETYTVGSAPAGDSLTWSQQTFSNPFPIKYTLRGLDAFLRGHFSSAATLAQNQHIVDGVKQALDSYCIAHLLPKGEVKDCNPPSEDITARVSNQCRVCQGSCGTGFTENGGAVQMDSNWPDWASQFAPGCQDGTYGRQVPGGQNTLCCEKDDEITTIGECRLCSSCGGDWRHYGGKMVRDSRRGRNFSNIYDHSCNGEANRRSITGGLSMCCKGEKICSLCSSCGGEFPEETGAYGRDTDWYGFFEHLGEKCQGEYGQHRFTNGAKLCCKSRQVN